LFDFIRKSFLGLKRRKYHILFSWILLVCFSAGQYMVYAHQHKSPGAAKKVHGVAKNTSRQTVKERCDLCDVMHHNAMLASYQVHFDPVAISRHVFQSIGYHFTSMQLILAAGRAPPFQWS
jgi:hypothetical protein